MYHVLQFDSNPESYIFVKYFVQYHLSVSPLNFFNARKVFSTPGKSRKSRQRWASCGESAVIRAREPSSARERSMPRMSGRSGNFFKSSRQAWR